MLFTIIIALIILIILDYFYGIYNVIVKPNAYAKIITYNLNKKIQINNLQFNLEDNYLKLISGWNNFKLNDNNMNIYLEENSKYIYILYENKYYKIDPGIKLLQIFNLMDKPVIIIFDNLKNKTAIKILSRNLENINLPLDYYILYIKIDKNNLLYKCNLNINHENIVMTVDEKSIQIL